MKLWTPRDPQRLKKLTNPAKPRVILMAIWTIRKGVYLENVKSFRTFDNFLG